MDFKLFLFLAFGCIQMLYSQSDSTQFIYYNSRHVIYPKTLEYRKPEMREAYLFVDSAKIKMDGVQFFKSNDGFFARFEDDFARANIKGKVNFYSLDKKNSVLKDLIFYDAPAVNTISFFNKSAESDKFIYPGALYNKGFGELARANYKNLSFSLADNKLSMKMLRKYRRSVIREMIFYPLGTILCSTATYFAFNENPTKVKAFPVFLTSFVGFGFLVAGSINTMTKRNKFIKAIRIYNL